jgi:ATP-dependent helicase STH1/SNF2
LSDTQRSILEADQEEENEEAGDMNDDELNEMLARNDDEVEIFRAMDIQRDRDALNAWRAAGNRGKPLQGLMQLEELPECYQTDEPFEAKELDESLEGRGQRRRNIVNYNDGLSDEQWAMVRLYGGASRCVLMETLGCRGRRGFAGAR